MLNPRDRPDLRRRLVVLMFVAIMLNYVDRQIIALLKPTLQAQFRWSETAYGHLASAFQFAVAIGSLGAGFLLDRIGVRRGFALGVGAWSLAAMAHALVSTVAGFTLVRLLLGVAEAAGTPAVIKTAATYFSPQERTRALSVSNMAPSLGAVVAPLTIPPLAVMFGWRATFLAAGGLGLVWAAVWLADTRPQAPHAPPNEPADRIGWSALLAERRTWALIIAKSLTDLVWWFLLFFMPDLFHRRFHLDQASLGLPVALVYGMAAAGSFSGGWLHGRLRALGLAPDAARKLTMLLFAAAVSSAPLMLITPGPWIAAGLLGVLLFSYQGFSTNLFGVATDLFPASAVASVMGLATFAGNLSGVSILELSGWSLEHGYGYAPMLGLAAVSCLAALAVLVSLAPGLDRQANFRHAVRRP